MKRVTLWTGIGVLAGMLLSGAAAPAAGDGGRLAVVFDVSPQVTNHHVGVTAFGNFETRLDNDWGLDARVRDDVLRALGALGVDHVVVDDFDREVILGNACFGGWSGDMKDACSARYQSLLKAHGATRMLDVATGSGTFRGVGPNPAYGIGLYTRGSDRPNIAIPFVFLYFQTYDGSGNPLKLSNPHHCGVGPSENRSPWQKTIGAQTVDDLAWLRPRLEKMIRINVTNAMSRLGFSGDPPPKCTRAGTPVDLDELAD